MAKIDDPAQAGKAELWDAINDYVRACGDDPQTRGNLARVGAVLRIERVCEERMLKHGKSGLAKLPLVPPTFRGDA